MKHKNICLMVLLGWILALNVSCKKYLEAKSNQSLSTPSTLDDLQAIADNFNANFSTRANNDMSDEYYLDYSYWQIISQPNQESYKWDANANVFSDWNTTYKRIFDYNTILDHLKQIDRGTDPQKWDVIKGTALYFRAYFHSRIADLYAPQYDANKSTTDLGIPLRMTSDFNVDSKQSTVQQTYDQLLADFNEAAVLLPNIPPTTKLYKWRPTKAACYAMLAKTYLQVGNYAKAYEFSNQTITTYDFLLDFNSSVVDTNAVKPFPTYDNNGEIIFYIISNGPLNSYNNSYTDSVLYKSYSANDLRRKVYFNNNTGRPYYKGPYTGTTNSLFNGIAMDEVYLIRAEASARLGNAQPAMTDLNTLLSKRYKTGTFPPYSGLTSAQILPVILEERKKELVGRGTRWADLRRLNKETAFAVSIKRKLNNQEYTLPPNDYRYALLIPSEVMIKTTLKQNPR